MRIASRVATVQDRRWPCAFGSKEQSVIRSPAKDAVPGNDRAPRSLIAVYCLVAVDSAFVFFIPVLNSSAGGHLGCQ